MRFRCSFSTMPATYNTPRCFEVAVKESLISPAMSPTDASRDFLRYWRMASRRLLANAFICFSISFNTESSITHTHTHTHTHTLLSNSREYRAALVSRAFLPYDET